MNPSEDRVRIACVVAWERDGQLSLTWSQGVDAFPRVVLNSGDVAQLRAEIDRARECLACVARLDSSRYYDLAAAGYALRDRLFSGHGDEQSVSKRVMAWLDKLRVETVEFVSDDTVPDIPWNLVYEADPEPFRKAFTETSAPEPWEPFWGVKYNLAGGRRVDPRRRTPLPRHPSVLFVVQDEAVTHLTRHHPEVLGELTEYQKREGCKWISTRAELVTFLKQKRPDVLYWLGHTTANGELELSDRNVSPLELGDWLRANGARPPGGVVFLNACDTTNRDERGGSFLNAVLRSGMGGGVATEELVVGTFANQVGVDFLKQFLGGRAVGEVMHDIRRTYRPRGLVYGVYCPPELRVVTEPEPEETEPPGSGQASRIGVRRPAPESLTPGRPPYPSLNYYDRKDRFLFAGREKDAERFALVLDDDGTRVVVLHGESGSGKSSFLRAGVIPYLEDECVGYQFPLKVRANQDDSSPLFVRATNDLAGQLAAALAAFAAEDRPRAGPDNRPVAANGQLADALRGATGGAADPAGVRAALVRDATVLGRALAAFAGVLPYRLVLVIDQAEEVFTLSTAGTAATRTPTADALAILRAAAAAGGEFKLIVSLRTEYYGRLVAGLREGLRAAVGVRDYLLTDLNAAALREAIERPTRFPEYGFRYAPGLVAKLSEELIEHTTGRQDSVLPLAQVVCAQLYDRAKNRPNPATPRGDAVITPEDLAAIGGVEGGMKRHAAEMVRRQFPDPADAAAFRRLLADEQWPLFRRQPDGTLTTDLRAAEELKARWRGRMPFDEMLTMASSGDMRLLRRSERIAGGEPQTEVSLGHDSLAPVAAEWQDELTRRRRLRRATAWGTGSLLLVLAAVGVVVWMSVLFNRANRETTQRQDTMVGLFVNTIGQNESETRLNQLEVEALWKLGGLEHIDEKVRTDVIQKMLSDPDLANRWAAKAELLTHAVVGLDPERREKVVRDSVLPTLRDTKQLLGLRLAAARVGAYLDADGDNFWTLALGAADETVSLGEKQPDGSKEREAALAFRTNPSSLSFLARISRAIERSDPPGPETTRLVDQCQNLLVRLTEENNFRFVPSSVWTYENWASAGGSPEMWKPVDVADAIRHVRAVQDPDFDVDFDLQLSGAAFSAVLERLGSDDAACFSVAYANEMISLIAEKPDARSLWVIGWAIGEIARQLDANVAAALATKLVDRMTAPPAAKPNEATPAPQRADEFFNLSFAVGVLARRLDVGVADALAKRLHKRMSREDDAALLELISIGLGGLTERLDPHVAGPIASAAVARLVDRMVAADRSSRWNSSTHWAKTQATRLGYGTQEVGLAALAKRLTPEDAEKLAKKLAARMADEKDAFALQNLSACLAALLPRVPTVHALAEEAANRLVKRIAGEKLPAADGSLMSLAMLGGALGEFLEWVPHPAAEKLAADTVRQIVERLPEEIRNRPAFRNYGFNNSVEVLVRRLDATASDDISSLLLKQLSSPGVRQTWDDPRFELFIMPSKTNRVLAAHLKREERTDWANRILRTPLSTFHNTERTTLDWKNWRTAFESLPDDLPTCVEWLKAPTCGSLFRQAFLRKAGTLAGQEFRTVWEFEAWARTRPDLKLDFTSLPRSRP